MNAPYKPPLLDAEVREAIRSDLDATMVIEAAAGTGKTFALVSRIVSVLASGRGQLKRMVAVTFTEKAAGELKLRLREEIESARIDPLREPRERALLTAALQELEAAHIGTIHSFCADLLRERPVEARIDPMFEVAPEDSAAAMLDAAFDDWFERALQAPGVAMRRLLRRREIASAEGPRLIARRAAGELLAWRDFTWNWQPYPFERDSEIDALVAEIVELGALARQGDAEDWLATSLGEIARPVEEAIRLEPVRGRDYDALEAVMLTLRSGRRWERRGFGGPIGGIEREEIFARRDRLRGRLERLRTESGANLAPILRQELWPIEASYAAIKRRAGKLDFLDLLLLARNLVRDDAAVRAELQARISHIFIDEFQDIDPLQAEILMLLATDDPAVADWRAVRPVPGKLFIVGDPKQSIYRFRRADVALYQEVKNRLRECGARVLNLSVSFRATPALQAMINAAFAPLMAPSGTQAAYAPLEPYRPDVGTQPPVVVLPVPDPYGDFGREVDFRIEESLPDAVAAFAGWLVKESGWTVSDRENPTHRIPIAARHICILFRRFNSHGDDVTRPYLRALEARHLPHVLIKGRSFSEREEVTAMRNLLAVIERPDDELAAFAALHGPFFSLSDDLLLEYHEAAASMNLMRHPPADLPDRLGPVLCAREIILELHRARNRRSIAETISTVLERTRAHAAIAIWPTGDQALANIMRLMDQARRYEARSGAISFRGFIDELEARAARDQAGETAIVEDGVDGVRIMTVHSAKGLEFPVVILADITCKETAGEPSRYIDAVSNLAALRIAGCAPRELLEHQAEEQRRDEEEAIRLLYVASTRARDLLVVPALGDNEYSGWLARLAPVIHPAPAERRNPLSRHPAGCPEFGADSVRTRPLRAPGPSRSVAPGLHRAAAGGNHVVWWDPSLLILNVHAAMGLRQSKLLEADGNSVRSTSGDQAHRKWAAARRQTLSDAARPTIPAVIASALGKVAAADASIALCANEVGLEEVARDRSTSRRRGFGTLVHEIMLRIPLDAREDEIRRIAINVGRILAVDEDLDAAVSVVRGALGSNTIAAALRACELHREFPIIAKLDDGTLIDGIADLVFRTEAAGESRWTVVDFKTDADLAPRIADYRKQVAAYMRGIEAATGLAADGIILWL